MQAERAEIAKVSIGWEDDLFSKLRDDALEKNELAKREGGLLRFRSNPAVLDLAINDFERVRTLIQKHGIGEALGNAILTKLAGRRLEGDHTPDFLRDICYLFDLKIVDERLFRASFFLKELEATLASEQSANQEPCDEEPETELLRIVNEQIEELKHERDDHDQLLYRRAALDAEAAVIPSSQVLDRLLRYEAHLSREFDRTLSQLERLQRMRAGQPVPPPLKVDVSS